MHSNRFDVSELMSQSPRYLKLNIHNLNTCDLDRLLNVVSVTVPAEYYIFYHIN